MDPLLFLGTITDFSKKIPGEKLLIIEWLLK